MQPGAVRVRRELFGVTASGAPVYAFILSNTNGIEVRVLTWGATVAIVRVPGRNRRLDDVVLGFDTLTGYLGEHPHFGGIIGRYADRIEGGRFRLDGRECQLTRNDGLHHLHGGVRGFDRALWQGQPRRSIFGSGVDLSYLSPDGEENYPGELRVHVRYTLTHDDALRVDYEATTDQPTIINLASHVYFNLAGAGDVLKHRIEIHGSRFLTVGPDLIPTGEMRAVAGTPFDFTTPTAIGARLRMRDEQLQLAGGFDHTWVLDAARGKLALAARAWDPVSGRKLEVTTTQPGVHFHTANFPAGTIRGKGNELYRSHPGFCLQPQHFPDSPNHPEFPGTVLRPGETYRHTTVYAFGLGEL